jgi:type I restriction enzyme M protein
VRQGVQGQLLHEAGQARGVFGDVDFANQERFPDARLEKLLAHFEKHRLRNSDVPPDMLGDAYMYLIEQFAEGAGKKGGEFYTPRQVVKLIVECLDPQPGMSIYDPTCGTGGMLSESDKLIADPETGLNPGANVKLFGQEYNPESYAICGSDLMIKGEDVKNIVYGNTLGTGKPKEGFTDGDGHPEERFHFMLANPPFGVEWKKIQKEVEAESKALGFAGRFGPGLPRVSDGSLLFLMHLISKMRPAQDGGCRFGIVLNFNGGNPTFILQPL